MEIAQKPPTPASRNFQIDCELDPSKVKGKTDQEWAKLREEGDLIFDTQVIGGIVPTLTVFLTGLASRDSSPSAHTSSGSVNSKEQPLYLTRTLVLSSDCPRSGEQLPKYPHFFPKEELNHPEFVLATLREIVKETYHPEVVRHLSFESIQRGDNPVCYFMRIHAEPAPAPDEVR